MTRAPNERMGTRIKDNTIDPYGIDITNEIRKRVEYN